MDRQAFAARLRALRAKAGLTRRQFADQIGRGIRIVESWEQGLRSPRPFELSKVADVLGCTLDDLLREVGPALPPPPRGRPPTKEEPPE